MNTYFRMTIRTLSSMALFKPRPVVISGPSGSGKSTLIKRLFQEYPTAFAFSVSHTTRKPRSGEQHGREYYFVSRNQMEKMIGNGEFLETTEFSSNLYGTSKQAVEDIINTGRICLLDVDKQGVVNVRKTNLRPLCIYIKPPNLEILEQRLRARATDTESDIQRRLKESKESIEFSQRPGMFDHMVLNDKLDVAYTDLKDVLYKEIEKVLQHQRGKEQV